MSSLPSESFRSGEACDRDRDRAISAWRNLETPDAVGRLGPWCASMLVLVGAIALACLVSEPPWAYLPTVALGLPRLERYKKPVCWTGYKILSSFLEDPWPSKSLMRHSNRKLKHNHENH